MTGGSLLFVICLYIYFLGGGNYNVCHKYFCIQITCKFVSLGHCAIQLSCILSLS